MTHQDAFDTHPRTFAFSLQELQGLPDLIDLYGAELPVAPLAPQSKRRTIKCLAGIRDQVEAPLILRALQYPFTTHIHPLTDGRLAVAAYWSLASLQALNDSLITATELTPAQLQELLSPPSI